MMTTPLAGGSCKVWAPEAGKHSLLYGDRCGNLQYGGTAWCMAIGVGTCSTEAQLGCNAAGGWGKGRGAAEDARVWHRLQGGAEG
eukprot:365105-Chlamydomonas_euryale.AAC.7